MLLCLFRYVFFFVFFDFLICVAVCAFAFMAADFITFLSAMPGFFVVLASFLTESWPGSGV